MRHRRLLAALLSVFTLLLMVDLWLTLQRPAHSAPPSAVEYKVVTLKSLIAGSTVSSGGDETKQAMLVEQGMNRLGREGWHLLWIQGDYYIFTK